MEHANSCIGACLERRDSNLFCQSRLLPTIYSHEAIHMLGTFEIILLLV
jgi:hypothetical protein